MSEQPTAKRLKPWQRAMQVIPEWMEDWEIEQPLPSNTRGLAAFNELHARLKTAFQEDEAVRADLLAACEEAHRAILEQHPAPPRDSALHAARMTLFEAIVKAQETDR